MTSYADTSFVFSAYVSDANSKDAVAEMASIPVCVLSELTTFEFANALAGCRFRREISQEDVERVLGAFDRDIASGVFTVHPFPPEIFARAMVLTRDHTSRLGTRSLDILHVAAAILLAASIFYTFDHRQARLARAAGLSVRPRSRR